MAVQFTSAGTYYRASNRTPGGSTYSGVMWVYFNADRNADSTILMLAPASTSSNSWYLGTASDGTSCYMAENSSSPGPVVMSAGNWYKLAFVVAGTAVSFYGSPLASALTKFTATATTAITPTQLYLGSDAFASWFNGRVAGFKMWNVALTDAEITAEFTQFTPVKSTGLLRYHRFATANTGDDSGLGGTLTATGSPSTAADPAGVPETAGPVPVSGSDSGTGSESGGVTAAVSGSDSGTGSETGGVSQLQSGSDSGTGSETGYVGQLQNGADTGSGSESGTIGAAVTSGDSGVGTSAMMRSPNRVST